MKKLFLILAICLGIPFIMNAQNYGTTKAVKIANGCGTENSKMSQIGSKIANPIDAILTGTTVEQQIESCNQHDKDYYNGVNKEKADRDFRDRSLIKGAVIQYLFKTASQEAYDASQESRRRSNQLRSTWEQENNACLNTNDYRVDYR